MIFAVVTLVAVLSVASADFSLPHHGHRVVCYMGAITSDFDTLRFSAADTEPALHLCTHVIFPCGLVRDSELVLHRGSEYNPYDTILNLVFVKKEKFPYLKIILGVGSFDSVNSAPYSEIAESAEARTSFVQHVLEFLLALGLDGIDIAWAFTVYDPGFTTKNVNQALLIKEMRKAFDKNGLIVSVSVLAGIDTKERGVDTLNLAAHAHFMSIGSHVHYDFRNIVERHLNYGVPPDKINLVLFSLGFGYRLDPFEDVKIKISKLPMSPLSTLMRYSELCREIEKGGWTEDMDGNTGIASFTNGNLIVVLDNVESIYLKILYAMNMTFGGIALRSLAADDYRGECHGKGGKYPILREIDLALVKLAPNAYTDILDRFEKYDASYFWNGMRDDVFLRIVQAQKIFSYNSHA